MITPRMLVIDIETSPNLAYAWSLFDQNIGISQLVESTDVICFAAKWLGSKKMEFFSRRKDGPEGMVHAAHALLNEADAVIHYNGRSFDVPHLNREFVQLGLNPPSPFKQVDLFLTVKKRFRFPSNKLEYVSNALNLGSKTKHDGFELWVRCLQDEPKAWALMERYNKQDVTLTEKLYYALRPWVPAHPSYAAFTGEHVCPSCNNKDLTKEGFAYTASGRFQQYRCPCGRWSRDTKRLDGAGIVEAVL